MQSNAGGATVTTTSGTTTSTITFDLEQEYTDRIPSYKAFNVASTIASLVSVLLMLASGIGMLGLQPWARKAALLWAVLYFLNLFVTVGYVMTYQVPANNAIADKWDQMPAPGPTLAAGIRLAPYLQLAFLVILLIYPSSCSSVLHDPPPRPRRLRRHRSAARTMTTTTTGIGIVTMSATGIRIVVMIETGTATASTAGIEIEIGTGIATTTATGIVVVRVGAATLMTGIGEAEIRHDPDMLLLKRNDFDRSQHCPLASRLR